MSQSSIAFITAHRLGDAISHTPTTRFLKNTFKDAAISVIAPSPEAYVVFKGNPDIKEVIDASKGIPDSLRGRKFDLIVSSTRKKSAVPICQAIYGPQLFLRGITESKMANTGIRPETMVEDIIIPHTSSLPIEALRKILQITQPCHDFRYTLPFSKQDESQVERILKQLDASNRTLIGLHLGCRSIRKRLGFLNKDITHEKAWRLNQATLFCQLLSEKHPDVRCLATGTQAEGAFTKKLATVCSNVIDAVDLFSIKEAAALMHRLKVCVVTDTGMLHIASSTPVPIVGLYAVTDPDRTGPYPGRGAHTAIQRDSMDAITGDIVFDTVHSILAEPVDS